MTKEATPVATVEMQGASTALRNAATAEPVRSELDADADAAAVGPRRVLAIIGADPSGEVVARAARDLATSLGASWVALHAERPGRTQDARTGLEVAAQLGAEIEIRAAKDIADEALALAAAQNVTAVVVARERRRWAHRWPRADLIGRLVHDGEGFSLHIVGENRPRQRRPRIAQGGLTEVRLIPWMVATALVGSVIGFGELLGAWLNYQALGMAFLAAVIVAAAFYGLPLAIYACIIGLLAWVVVFIPPAYSLFIETTPDAVTVCVFIGIAAGTGWLASRVRTDARAAHGRLDNIRRVSLFSRKLAEPTTRDHLFQEIARQASFLAGEAIVLTEEQGILAVRSASPDNVAVLDTGGWAAARWAFCHGLPAGRGAAILSGCQWLFLPLRTVRDLHGILGIRPEGSIREPQREALSALADQAAAALERVSLVAAAARSEAQVETQKLRTALLNSLSHDLRTPLTGIRGAAGLLRTAWDRLSPPVRSDLLASIEEDTIRMTRFLANITEMTRLESGQIVPRLERLAVRAVVQEAISRVPGIAPIAVEAANDLPDVLADATLLEQVLVNVLENARKYSQPCREISLTAASEGTRVRIEIADQGVGIAPADLPHVFNSFYRARRGDRTVPGTGLGLAIARGLMDAMGGSIDAISPCPDAPGGGYPGTLVRIALRTAT